MERTGSASSLSNFDLHGWVPNPDLEDDENYMDIVFLITRSTSAQGQQGHMGSLIVRPSNLETDISSPPSVDETNQKGRHATRLLTNVLGAATNTPLFGTQEVTSDIHAEIAALGQACQAGHSSTGCTVYITIPPCKRCFAALVAFGITRVVTRQAAPASIRETALRRGMSMEHFSPQQNRRQMERINRLVNPHRTDAELMEIAERNRERRRMAKEATRSQHEKRKNKIQNVDSAT
eukprot:Nitzschia sp. Nitz4//scaffold46_size129759//121862//122569//NITZ4_003526-RA/size129759-processed-gene-0.211-mRNA-1//1//CDS//3329552670//254//frame0